MLRLILLRHAKSSWDEPGLEDYERPLAPRGRRNMPPVANYMVQHDLEPRTILCSSAQRARETLALALPFFVEGMSVYISPALYEADAPDLLAAVRGAGEAPSPLMVIGHNPGLGDFALQMARADDSEDYRAMRVKFPTAAIAVIDFEGDDWGAIETGSGRLHAFVKPRDLPT